MAKRLSFVSGALLLSVMTCAIVVACGDDSTSTFGDGQNDSGSDSPGTFNVDSSLGDGSSGGDGAVGAKCEPVIASGYTKQWTAPAQPASSAPCQSGDFESYFTDCLASLGQDGGAAACDAWKTAHGTCLQCIEPTNNSGPIQWYQEHFYYTSNIAGCIAIKQDKYGADDCSGAYGGSVNCNRDACGGCFKTGTSTFNDFLNCENAAKSVGICKSLDMEVPTKCTDVQTATETKPCFKASGEDAKTYYTRLMGVFCGG